MIVYTYIMKSNVRKWGNSLAIRLPKSLADELKLSDSSVIDLSVSSGQLIVQPKRRGELARLLAQITDANQQIEIEVAELETEAW